MNFFGNDKIDIDDYSVEELCEYFSLPKNYSTIQVEQEKDVLVQSLKSKSIDEKKKQKILLFLEEASIKLKKSFSVKTSSQIVETSDNHFVLDAPQNMTVIDGKEQKFTKALHIDSRFRDNYFNTMSSDMLVDLPEKMDNVTSMHLVNIDIPLTFYGVSKYNQSNSFTIMWSNDVYDSNSGSIEDISYTNVETIIIPDGNYESKNINKHNVASIEDTINGLIGATNAGLSPLNLRFGIDKASGKSIFNQDTANIETRAVSYKIIFHTNDEGAEDTVNPLPSKLGWKLGYRLGEYVNVDGSNLTSEGICYMVGPQYIYVSIDDFNNNVNNYYSSAFSDSVLGDNIIARINTTKLINDSGFYQRTRDDDGNFTMLNRTKNYHGPVDIKKLKISLLDEFGRKVNLNNMDWSLELMFEIKNQS